MGRRVRFGWPAIAGALLCLGLGTAGAAAQGTLVLYCAVQEEWCRAAVAAFERETGIKVSMTRKSSGEVYAQVKAVEAEVLQVARRADVPRVRDHEAAALVQLPERGAALGDGPAGHGAPFWLAAASRDALAGANAFR